MNYVPFDDFPFDATHKSPHGTYFPFDATHKSPHSIISDTHLNAFSHFYTEPDCMFLVQTILKYLREVDYLFSQSIGFYENGVELTTYRTVRGNARVVEKKFTSVGIAARDRWKDLVESGFYYRREVHFLYDDNETTEEAYTRLKSLKKDFCKLNIKVQEKMETLFELERTFGLIPIGDASFLQVVPQKRRMWVCMNGHWMNTL